MQVRLASVGYDGELRLTPLAVRVCILTDYYYPQLGGITEHVHGQAVNLGRARARGDDRHRSRAAGAARRRPQRSACSPTTAIELVHMGLALPLYGNGSQTLHTVFPGGALPAAALPRRAAVRRRPRPRALQPELLHARAVRAARAARSAVGTYHSVFTPGRCATSCTRPRGPSLQPPARPRRRLGRLRRAARPLLPRVRLARDPERHRRGALHAGSAAADRGPARERRRRSCSSSGASIPRNGLGIMLEAFDQLWRARDGHAATVRRRRRPAAPLLRERGLAPEVAASVHWAGRVDWNRPRYYASADVFCTPCQRASFGMVLLEAMSCGRPVVASMISGFEMLLTSGREGLLVAPPDEPAAFAAALGYLLDSSGRARAHGRRGPPHGHHAATRGTTSRPSSRTYYLELRGELPVGEGAPAAPARGTRPRLTRCAAWDASLSSWLPPLAWMAIIFAFSSQHGGGHLPASRGRAAQARARDRSTSC